MQQSEKEARLSEKSGDELVVPANSTPWQMDKALGRLREGANAFASLPLSNRIHLIDHGIAGVHNVAEKWVRLACKAKGLDFEQHESAEEWLGGPMTALRNLRMLREALLEIRDLGTPRLLEDSVSTREDGRTVVRVFPRDTFDKALYAGFVADVWMQDGVTPDNVVDTMAVTYQSDHTEPNVTLVLGAGNVASIGPMDVMHQLFVDNSVCLLKLNPVNAYLGPVFEEAFAV